VDTSSSRPMKLTPALQTSTSIGIRSWALRIAAVMAVASSTSSGFSDQRATMKINFEVTVVKKVLKESDYRKVSRWVSSLTWSLRGCVYFDVNSAGRAVEFLNQRSLDLL
jgi:hypothetical protein